MRTRIALAAVLASAAAALFVASASGEDKPAAAKGPDVGAQAPDFRLNDQDGKGVRLADVRGSAWVVLAFFPKAMTPG